jgi:hypothetical protein
MFRCEQLVSAVLVLFAVGCGASQSFSDRIFDDGTVRYRVGSLASGFGFAVIQTRSVH